MDFGSTEFWYDLKLSSLIFPYIRKELDRKFNPLSKIRRLKETDSDLVHDLTGKVCVITGGTRGIGAEVVKTLLRKNCHVITGSSSKKLSDHQKAFDNIRAEVPEDKGKLEIWHIDLRSMDSVVEFTNRFKETKLPLNYLIENAGIWKFDHKLTVDRFEEHFSINYLSHCLLIDRLIDIMYETSKTSNTESRIVLVSSAIHKGLRIRFNDLMLTKTFTRNLGYGQSKLAMIMFTYRFNRWLIGKGEDWSKAITINSLHPGICNTQLISHLPLIEQIKPMAAMAVRSPKEGAETTIYTTLSTNMNAMSGKYLEDSAIEEPSVEARNVEDQEQLWKMTWNLLDKWTEHYWI